MARPWTERHQGFISDPPLVDLIGYTNPWPVDPPDPELPGLAMTWELVLDSPFNVPIAPGHCRGVTNGYGSFYFAKDAGGPIDAMFSAAKIDDGWRFTDDANPDRSFDMVATQDAVSSVPDGTAWNVYGLFTNGSSWIATSDTPVHIEPLTPPAALVGFTERSDTQHPDRPSER